MKLHSNQLKCKNNNYLEHIELDTDTPDKSKLSKHLLPAEINNYEINSQEFLKFAPGVTTDLEKITSPKIVSSVKAYYNKKNKDEPEITYDNQFHNNKDFENLDEYHKYQLKKKIDKSIKIKKKKQNEKFATVDSRNNILKEDEIAFNDLFGQAHPEQGSNKKINFLVSRGFPIKPGASDIDAGEEWLDSAVNPQSDLTTAVCKTCPISTIQEYEFNPEQIGLPLPVDQMKNRTGNYFIEKGGTYNPNGTNKVGLNDKCQVCDYPDGCFSPTFKRFNMYQTQSCSDGKNRVCKPCAVCAKGEQYSISFCGEGSFDNNTECKNCTPCDEGTYKVFGCDLDNSNLDNVCLKMTDCLGKPGELDIYKDPFKRTYESKEGYTGSNKTPSKEESSYEYQYKTTPEDKNSPSVSVERPRIPADPDSQNPVERDLKTPYYGRDRQCTICDNCPEGYKLIHGCTGKNSKYNSICQREIDSEEIKGRPIKCPKGTYYNKSKVQELIDEKNKMLQDEDEEIRKKILGEKYVEDIKANKQPDIKMVQKIRDINNVKNYNAIPTLSDEEIINKACVECKVCGENTFINPRDKGCYGTTDTKCIPHTKCRDDGSERLVKAGTPITNNICGKCLCPPGFTGTNPICYGDIRDLSGPASSDSPIEGCVKNIQCYDKLPKDKIIGCSKDDESCANKFTYDEPSKYGDTTRPNKCKKCKDKCPVGSYKIGGCEPDKNTDLVCKNHRECDSETMIVLEPGTSEQDTICKCIDGYELPKDEFGLTDNLANKCVKIKGECQFNPCHPNATCYDNFNKKGDFVNHVCKCDTNNNWVETEYKGEGDEGCRKVPDNHFHNVEKLIPPPNVSDMKSDLYSAVRHTGTIFHKAMSGFHLHK